MTETHSSVLPRRQNTLSPRRRSSTWVLNSLEVSSAAAANGKSDPLPRPNARALDAPLMNPLRDMSISFCSPPKASKSQKFAEFKDFEERSSQIDKKRPNSLLASAL